MRKYVGKIKHSLALILAISIFLSSTSISSAATTEHIIFHHTDHLSGTNIDTDENGNILEAVDYYPYGEVRIDQKSTTYENKHKFTGKELDKSDNLYYYGARYYDPSTGRFISQDPADGDPSNPQSLNKYSYVMNNPLKYVDPSGNMAELVAAAGVTIGGILSIPMSPVIIGGAAIMAGIAGGVALYENSKALSMTTSNSKANINTQAQERTKNDNDYITLYRGDDPGKNGFVANGLYNGVIDPVYGLWKPGGLTKAMVDRHTSEDPSSKDSMFISTTASKFWARHYATNDNKKTGMVYKLQIPRGQAYPIGNAKEEYFIPLVITGDKIKGRYLVHPDK